MHRSYTKKQKQQILSDWESSGISARIYCTDKLFSVSSVYKWRHEFAVQKEENFVQLSPIIDMSTKTTIYYPNGVRLDLDQTISVPQLIELIKC